MLLFFIDNSMMSHDWMAMWVKKDKEVVEDEDA
jgi:hypothetical protein